MRRGDEPMTRGEPAIRNISDTANWAAAYRARETDRPDALFRDPFARRLAGERGEQIFASLPARDRHSWAWVMRTYLFDQFIAEQIKQGADMVVNLAAGLDARPYRMPLPASLKWIEVDLPGILAYKEDILKRDRPACVLERVRLDLSNLDARRDLFERLGRGAGRALILTEGLLVYLSADEVGALARDLAGPPAFKHWLLDVVSPGLLRMMQKKVGSHLSRASAPFRFGPVEGPGFFAAHGWPPAEVRSIAKTALRTRRAPLLVRLFSFLPESNGRQGSSPWSGVCLLTKQGA
jgi:methyltransferase (TIGR00027 family)